MTVRRLTVLAGVLVSAGVLLAQAHPKKGIPEGPPKPAPGSLEDTLEKALRNSADIKAAEAKVRDSEAELNRVRHQVLTKATILHSDLNLARRMSEVAEAELAQTIQLAEAKTVPREMILKSRAQVEKHKGEIEKLEAELKALRGEFAIKDLPIVGMAFDPATGHLVVDGGMRNWTIKEVPLLDDAKNWEIAWKIAASKPAAVQAPMMDRVKKLLDQEVAFEAPTLTLEQALRDLLATAKSDVPVRAILHAVQAEARVELPAGKLPVGAWIQALEDTDDKVVVVVRDYGLLISMKDRIPDGALRVQDLWKGNYVELKKPEKK